MGKMNFENCVKCGEKLRGATRVRKKPKRCFKCLGQSNYYSHNYELSRLCKQIINEAKNSKTETEDQTHQFDDDPAAEKYNQNEVGKIQKQSVGIVFSSTSIGDNMSDEN